MRVYTHARSDRQDEVVYYDTFESADDITEDDSGEKKELHRLHASVRQLEARRGRIIAKRSYLRNKRVRASSLCLAKILFCTFRHIFLYSVQEICVSNHTQKQHKRQTVHKGSISQQLSQVEWCPRNNVTLCYVVCREVAVSLWLTPAINSNFSS